MRSTTIGTKTGVMTACLFIASITSMPAHAGTIGISYNLSGGPTGPPVVSGTTLLLDGLFTGSILAGDASMLRGIPLRTVITA